MVPFSCSSRMARDILSRHILPLGVAMPYPNKRVIGVDMVGGENEKGRRRKKSTFILSRTLN